ncbi:anti-silence-domain-containing protein [Gymnopus androsaceus JB14]|uniref:Anti-silencing function protein 1 n=1 Tax=Gymnopus androsaceus JB14 TaxID=1447944 RepID=A0A6A4IE98_9AGAR|nr:anti-silence-domain-containing protein [Gymnopus androsaceus JB14]KAE9407618.1 anti-silence-domain-containing protein [Gymnopus androsaceus JB14]
MSIVSIRNVEFLNNPARFTDPYRFRVTFECLSPLPDDLEWKLIYVSSPENAALDQELDSCLVGPVPPGINSFEFLSPSPDPKLIPEGDLMGVAALILTGSYNDQEFVRVGYYQNTEHELAAASEGGGDAVPPAGPVAVEKLVRDITKKPRVTRFQIKWDVSPPPGSSTSTSLGASTSAAVPSADSYGQDAETEDKMDVDGDGGEKDKGTKIPIS